MNDQFSTLTAGFDFEGPIMLIPMPGGLQLHCWHSPALAAMETALWPGTPGLGLSALLARAALAGANTWALGVMRGDSSLGGAFAVLERGRLNARLTVMLVNGLPGGQDLMIALERLAAKLGATAMLLEIVSAQAGQAPLPALLQETVRYTDERLYVIDLSVPELARQFGSNTRRNINKGRKAGLQVRVQADELALQAHADLTGASMSRRQKRGESVALRGSMERVIQLLASGGGRLFQACLGEQVLSSKLVFTLGRHGYYYDGGSSSQGMELGASQFLMAHIIDTLREEGMLSYNLEIASAGNTGLMRYKEGFAPQLWYVERVAVERPSPWRKLRNLLRGF